MLAVANKTKPSRVLLLIFANMPKQAAANVRNERPSEFS
jgi:hypothetical protein